MAIVLTNGEFYIKLAENGKVEKTNLMEDAEIFTSVNKAVEVIKRARKKTTNYYVYDTETRCICWKNYKRRKQYSRGTRELIYKQANGCCQLCGRKITYEQATLDHVIPLVMGGIDSVENLQLSCNQCNQLKGNILPETFVDRITEIFMYQMEKKCGNNLKWKIAKNLLTHML